jgi:hypothetical protein
MLTIIDRGRALLSAVVARGSSVRTDPLDGVKRRAYLIATLSGLPAVLLVWISIAPAVSSPTLSFRFSYSTSAFQLSHWQVLADLLTAEAAGRSVLTSEARRAC